MLIYKGSKIDPNTVPKYDVAIIIIVNPIEVPLLRRVSSKIRVQVVSG